ncbi:MAG: ribonuclease PH [Candidatus Aureabacteria bacterium]|nr:ribonuclease PH [Candidatus Auribacterota bacterium]
MKKCETKKDDQLRPVSFQTGIQEYPDGSVLAVMGMTRIICSVFIQEGVPKWLPDESGGWATCEYDMLPGSTTQRNIRDSSRGRVNARSADIKRLIGRAMRSVLDLKKIPGKTIWIDCDVLQADGGTRTASINGAYVALKRAIKKLLSEKKLKSDPVTDSLAAVSVGIIDGKIVMDLDYEQDSRAEADMNIVMTGSGRFVEVQATGEKRPFTKDEFLQAIEMAGKGISQIIKKQEEVIHESSPGHVKQK